VLRQQRQQQPQLALADEICVKADSLRIIRSLSFSFAYELPPEPKRSAEKHLRFAQPTTTGASNLSSNFKLKKGARNFRAKKSEN